MKRVICLCLTLMLTLPLMPAPVRAAGVTCQPGDTIYAVFALAEDSERADGVMGRFSYPLDIFNVLPSADLIGLDGFNILNLRPAVIAFRVNQYAPAGEYTIEATMVEAVDADGTRHENVRIEPVRVVVESASAKEEAMAEKAELEQRLTEIEAALTEAETARTELQNQNASLQNQNASLQNQVEALTAEKKETEYRLAEALYASGDYVGAKAQYQKLNGYRDAASKAKACEQAIAARKAIQPGEYVTFGRFSQTAEGNDETPIEWLVLEVQGNKALLLSRYGLDGKPYNTEYTGITWEKCTLRAWLNGTLLNKAFTAQEQAAIMTTMVDNSKSQGYWDTSGGNNTEDKIFLLSYKEANKYFGVTPGDGNNKKARTSPTAYALQAGAWTSSNYQTAEGNSAGWWWLRSPGFRHDFAGSVSYDGSLNSPSVDDDDAVVRPALWVNLDAGIFGY